MRPASLLCALLLLAGCGHPDPFKKGDVLVAASDRTVLGTVIEIGDHSFDNGASGRSLHVELPSGKDAWYSMDTTTGTYIVKR
jgi:major membrane immunogen (membrane-anchored lipoprotein)